VHQFVNKKKTPIYLSVCEDIGEKLYYTQIRLNVGLGALSSVLRR